MRLASHRRAVWLETVLTTMSEQPVWRDRASGAEVARFGSGEPIVLLPGIAGGWRLVMPLARRLARLGEVICIDLPEGRNGDGVEGDAASISGAIERMGLERPTVFGVSYGGVVALQMAADHPGVCDRLIVYGADRRFEHSGAAELTRRVLERFPLPTGHPFLNQFFNLLHGRKPEPGPLVDYVRRCCWATEQSVVAERLRSLAELDLEDRLGRIDVPTLVIAGLRDVIARPARQEALARSLGDARYRMIEGAGHVGFLTHRAEVTRLVRSFLRGRRAQVA